MRDRATFVSFFFSQWLSGREFAISCFFLRSFSSCFLLLFLRFGFFTAAVAWSIFATLSPETGSVRPSPPPSPRAGRVGRRAGRSSAGEPRAMLSKLRHSPIMQNVWSPVWTRWPAMKPLKVRFHLAMGLDEASLGTGFNAKSHDVECGHDRTSEVEWLREPSPIIARRHDKSHDFGRAALWSVRDRRRSSRPFGAVGRARTAAPARPGTPRPCRCCLSDRRRSCAGRRTVRRSRPCAHLADDPPSARLRNQIRLFVRSEIYRSLCAASGDIAMPPVEPPMPVPGAMTHSARNSPCLS